MSKYTNKLHEKALRDTQFWDSHTPQNSEEYFRYAEYQWDLKDYKIAVEWMQKAIQEGKCVLAYYRLGEAYWFGYGCKPNHMQAQSYFNHFIAHAKELKDSQALLFLGNCYKNGWGTTKDTQKAEILYLCMKDLLGSALSALGKLYKELDGQENRNLAKKYFIQALQVGNIDAPFELYALDGYDLEHFAYRNVLFEHFSFIVGRLMRVVELHPCKEYYVRLAHFYETGIPNDYEWNQQKFKKIAARYYKLSEQCEA